MKNTVSGGLSLITLFLAACVPDARVSGAIALPSPKGTWQAPVAATVRPAELPAYTGCYYAWATRELPELSDVIQGEFAQLSAGIQASAYAFGEECRGDDGTVAFLPMETDFRVRIPVTTLSDDAVLGAWISRAISIVEALPASEIPGTRPGRVEYEFFVDDSTGLRLVVEIARYRSEADGLDSAAVLQLFRSGP